MVALRGAHHLVSALQLIHGLCGAAGGRQKGSRAQTGARGLTVNRQFAPCQRVCPYESLQTSQEMCAQPGSSSTDARRRLSCSKPTSLAPAPALPRARAGRHGEQSTALRESRPVCPSPCSSVCSVLPACRAACSRSFSARMASARCTRILKCSAMRSALQLQGPQGGWLHGQTRATDISCLASAPLPPSFLPRRLPGHPARCSSLPCDMSSALALQAVQQLCTTPGSYAHAA